MAASREALFNQDLEFIEPLDKLWAGAEPFSYRSRLKGKRLLIPGKRILREYFAVDFSEVTAGFETISRETAEHRQKLKELGITVVSHRVELASYLDVHRMVVPVGAVVGHGASKYVPGTYPLDSAQARQNLSANRVRATVTDPVMRYLDWCAVTGSETILEDIYRPGQYSWQPRSGTIFLHDIDPFCDNNTPQALEVSETALKEDFSLAGY